MASRITGFIGTGIMGRGMALNLLKSGSQMVVWNRSEAKLEEFRQLPNVTIAASPAEVVRACVVGALHNVTTRGSSAAPPPPPIPVAVRCG